ncbi:hypothetical protein [Desulfofalx alkaliphila]|nr:hypothetical protein [Desulfofalx alkaliphila]
MGKKKSVNKKGAKKAAKEMLRTSEQEMRLSKTSPEVTSDLAPN